MPPAALRGMSFQKTLYPQYALIRWYARQMSNINVLLIRVGSPRVSSFLASVSHTLLLANAFGGHKPYCAPLLQSQRVAFYKQTSPKRIAKEDGRQSTRSQSTQKIAGHISKPWNWECFFESWLLKRLKHFLTVICICTDLSAFLSHNKYC